MYVQLLQLLQLQDPWSIASSQQTSDSGLLTSTFSWRCPCHYLSPWTQKWPDVDGQLASLLNVPFMPHIIHSFAYVNIHIRLVQV